MSYDAVVIGAGHNGLISANYLARAGKKVLVLERRDLVGGACVTETLWGEYRVSTGAYLCSLLLPQIVEELELPRYGFDVYRRTTAGFAPFPDGSFLFLYADAAKTRNELRRFCKDTPQDVEAYFAFEHEIERVADVMDDFMQGEPPTTGEIRAAFAKAGIATLYSEFIEGSVSDLLDKRFVSEPLKTVLATDGLIGTSAAPSMPGTAYVLLHHYLGRVLGSRGAWGYVRGGMGKITAALAEAFIAKEGEIRLSASVSEILYEEGKVTGVRLSSGETISAPIVLSNADPYTTFVKLMPGLLHNDQKGIWNSLDERGGYSCKINLAVSELPKFSCLPPHEGVGEEHLGTVHLCPDRATLERAWAQASAGVPSTEPMIEVYLQTSTDASLTPEGKHILSLFTQYFPYRLAPGLDLDKEREYYADRVLGIVGRYAPNVPGSVLHRQILTPYDLEQRFRIKGGHIFHGDLLPPHLWDTRTGDGFQGARTPVEGLYLCGSGAHPGGCVFGAPGYNAAQTALLHLQKENEQFNK
ncbi:MAG: NAD(P)/FAD-dependent oxidoreductase [Chthonomonadaceae bacterium]|nr:NAD(P)/FAD-dependent oxidoreductase [Chthonomonadaceae bacterium]